MKWFMLIIELLLRVFKVRREQQEEEAVQAEQEKQEAIQEAKEVSEQIAEEANNVPKPDLDPDQDPFAEYNRRSRPGS